MSTVNETERAGQVYTLSTTYRKGGAVVTQERTMKGNPRKGYPWPVAVERGMRDMIDKGRAAQGGESYYVAYRIVCGGEVLVDSAAYHGDR